LKQAHTTNKVLDNSLAVRRDVKRKTKGEERDSVVVIRGGNGGKKKFELHRLSRRVGPIADPPAEGDSREII